MVRTFYNSVHLVRPNGVAEFVGLHNFSNALFADPAFWTAVRNTAIFTVVGTPLDVFGGLLLALCLFARPPFARSLRVIWFLPVLMSYVVVGIIWVWIYDYDWGLLNLLLRYSGWLVAHSWLGDPATALWAVMVAHYGSGSAST